MGIFAQWCVLCLHLSSTLDQRPFKELRARRPTHRRAERRSYVANGVWFTGTFNLSQYGLTYPQPDGDVKVGSRSAVWTGCTEFGWFRFTDSWSLGIWTFAKADGHLQWPHWEGAAQEKKASTRHAAKRRRGKGAAITHWTCDSWPQQLLPNCRQT